MKIIRFIGAFILLFCHVFFLKAQTLQWLNYTNGNNIEFVFLYGNKVWCTSVAGITKVDMYGGNSEFINRANSYLPPYELGQMVKSDVLGTWVICKGNGIAQLSASSWVSYNAANSGLPTNYVSKLLIEDDSILWIGTNNGLVRFNGTHWDIFNNNISFPLLSIYDIAIDSHNNKWISGYGGIVKLDTNNHWNLYSCNPYPRYMCLAIDQNDHIWVNVIDSTYLYKALLKFDQSVWYDYTSEIYNADITSIAVDQMNNKWIGTYSGITKYNDIGYSHYSTYNSGLSNNEITDLTVDNYNTIWIATANGLYSLKDSIWELHNTSNAGDMNNDIHDIAIKDDTTWFGTANGVFRKHNNSFKTIPKPYDGSYFGSTNVNKLAFDYNDQLWIGSTARIYKLNDTIWTVYTNQNPAVPFNAFFSVWGIAFDLGNSAWIGITTFLGHDGGVLNIYDTLIVLYDADLGEFPTNQGSEIIADQFGNIWFATWGSGLVKFNGTDWEIFNTANSGIPDNSQRDVVIDETNNCVWVSIPNNGIAKYDGITWTHYTTTNSGLPFYDISFLEFDNNNNLWMGSSNGLAMFNGYSDWTVYNMTNAPFNTNMINCIYIDDFNNKWIGTDVGLVIYNENGIIDHIDNVTHNDNNITIFPNPAYKSFKVKYDGSVTGQYTINLVDASGKSCYKQTGYIYSEENSEFVINCEWLRKGVYIVSVVTSSDVRIEKIIIM